MIFTVAQLQNASYKYINKYAGELNRTSIKYYVYYYGQLSHSKIRNLKNSNLEDGEFISSENEFIEHCIMQYELFENVDKEIAAAYKCLIAGASYIIRLNEKVLKEANDKAESFLRKGE